MKLLGMIDLAIWVCRMELNVSFVTLSSPEVNSFFRKLSQYLTLLFTSNETLVIIILIFSPKYLKHVWMDYIETFRD